MAAHGGGAVRARVVCHDPRAQLLHESIYTAAAEKSDGQSEIFCQPKRAPRGRPARVSAQEHRPYSWAPCPWRLSGNFLLFRVEG